MAQTEVYCSNIYARHRVTGRYVRKLSGRKDTWRVYETSTPKAGRYAGRPGYGPTLREYDTSGEEIPAEYRPTHAQGTVEWPL